MATRHWIVVLSKRVDDNHFTREVPVTTESGDPAPIHMVKMHDGEYHVETKPAPEGPLYLLTDAMGEPVRTVTQREYHEAQRSFAHKGVAVGDHDWQTGYIGGRVKVSA